MNASAILKSRDPEDCPHGHLESIEQHLRDIHHSGQLVPVFVCTKCGAVLFVSRDVENQIVTVDYDE